MATANKTTTSKAGMKNAPAAKNAPVKAPLKKMQKAAAPPTRGKTKAMGLNKDC